jgi:hypothetical protein
MGFDYHVVGIFTCASAFLSTFFLQLPFERNAMGRGQIVSFVPLALMHFLLPVSLFVIPEVAGWFGRGFGVSPQYRDHALTLAVVHGYEPFSIRFFTLCAAIGLGLGLVKMLVFRFIGAPGFRRIDSAMMVLACITGTTIFLSVSMMDEKRVVGQLLHLVKREVRVPATPPEPGARP